MKSNQLSLNLPLSETATFGSFYPGDNQQLLSYLAKVSKGTGENYIYFYGKNGVGKSHLLQAACNEALHANKRAIYIPLKELPQDDPSLFEELEQLDLVCLDDIETIAGSSIMEEAIFNFYNRIQNNNGNLIIGAKHLPNALDLKLKDLESRLNLGLCFKLHELNEPAMLDALKMLCRRAGLELPDEVAMFLIKRVARDMTTITKLFDKLNQASLSEQHRLTVPFVKRILDL